jgi:hypothetical protein
VDGAPAVPGAVLAINAAIHNGLQGRYTDQRKTLKADEALDSSLKSSMSSKDYRAADRFLKGVGSEDADKFGRLIRDRLLIALENENAQALAGATSPWDQDNHPGTATPSDPNGQAVSPCGRSGGEQASRDTLLGRAKRAGLKSKPRRVLTALLLGALAVGVTLGPIGWYETVSYHHWVRACHSEGGTVIKTGTSSGGGGESGTWSDTTYACLAPDGHALSHHDTFL